MERKIAVMGRSIPNNVIPNQDESVRHSRCLFLIMRYMNERVTKLALQPIKFDSHLLSKPGIKSRDGLIHQIRLRLTHQRPPYGYALPLAPRKLRRRLVEQMSYMKCFRNLRDFDRDVLGVRPARDQRKR